MLKSPIGCPLVTLARQSPNDSFPYAIRVTMYGIVLDTSANFAHISIIDIGKTTTDVLESPVWKTSELCAEFFFFFG